MTYLVLAILILIVMSSLWLIRKTVNNLTEVNRQLINEVRLSTRTRVGTASMRSGAVTEEQVAKRLGRKTVARRRVVGGDEDSVLHTNLSKPLGGSNGS